VEGERRKITLKEEAIKYRLYFFLTLTVAEKKERETA
jgi:hypothetical protein